MKYGLLLLIVVIAAVVVVLSRMDFSNYRPLIAEKVKEATGRDFEIGGELKLDISLTPAIVVEDIRLHNAIFGTRPEMVKARRLEADVALLPLLLGRVEIKRLALIGPDILLETDEQGRSNWDFSSDDEPANVARPETVERAALDLPQLGAVTIENGLLTYRNGQTGRTAKFEVVRFTGSSSSRMSPLEIELEGAYDGMPFELAGRLGAFAALGSPRPFPVDLSGEIADLRVALKGSIARPLAPSGADFAVEASGTLRGIAQAFKLALPSGQVSLTSKLGFKDKVLKIENFQGKIGGSDLAGDLTVELRPERPLIAGSLTGQRFDLADVTPAESNGDNGRAKPKAKPAAGDSRLFSAEPLPLDGLRSVDGKLDAKFERLQFGRVALEQAALTATLQDGRLTLDPFSGVLARGEIKGSLAVAAADGGSAKLNLRVAKLDVNTLAQALEAGNILAGQVDIQADVAARGPSPRAWMSSLDGKASLVMGKGEVKSSYVELLGADLLRFAASAATSGGANTTPVNCLVGRFDIAKGLASSRDILFDTTQMTVKGEGTVNLGSERLALKFTPRPKDMSLVNLATPWRVEGTLAAPQVNVDELGAAKLAAGTLLSVVNPLALLVPLVTSAGGDRNPCLAALDAAAQGRAPAAKPESGGIGGFLDRINPLR